MLKQRIHSFLQHHHITKHMVKVYVSCFTIMISSGLTITLIFPYLPFMVKFLLPDVGDRNVGRYAGFMASSMYLGRLCGSYFWGWLADTHSKKTILMYSGICVAFSSLFFGFSINFYMAVIFRFLTGLSNGVVGNSKAIVYEHSDDINKGFGMSIMAASFGTAIVVGPAAAGLLADPIGQYNLPPNSFLEKFPYCLPSMFAAFLCAVGVIAVGFLLPDKPEKPDKVNEDDSSIKTGLEPHDQPSNNTYEVETDLKSAEDSPPQSTSIQGGTEVVDKDDNEEDTVIMDVFLVDEGEAVIVKRSLKLKKRLKQSKQHLASGCQVFLSLIKDKVTFSTVFLYGLFSFATIGFDECYSLWASTDRSLGGLDFTLSNIGTTLGIVGVLMTPLSLIVYNPMEKRFGTIMTFLINNSILVVVVLLFPSLTYTSGNKPVLWIILILALLTIRSTLSNCFICQALFINNSVTPDKLGAVNGLAITVTSLFRTFSPLMFGALYSLSLSDTTQHIGFPVDFHLIFILFSFVFLLSFIIVAFFPKRLEKQQKSTTST
ncbi:uncharacterized protein [Dysidea avara]|uniref:uncharacterized protein n=1 Tax=Dysidea avara TaxID=196820 RepID=UPI00331F559D